YLATTGVFLFWRIILFENTREATDVGSILDRFQSDPVESLFRLPLDLLVDFVEAVILAWFAPANATLSGLTTSALIATTVLGTVAVGLVVFYFFWMRRRSLSPDEEQEPDSAWITSAALVGITGIIFTMLPTLLSDREIRLLDLFDRYTIPPMMGISILVGAGLFALQPTLRIGALALLVSLSVVTQFNTLNEYRAEWQMQKDLWWQLSWRAPQIEPDTTLLVHFGTPPSPATNPTIQVSDDYEVWGPASIIYYPQATDPVIFGDPLRQWHLDMLLSQQTLEREIRGVTFSIPPENTLIVAIPRQNTGCLRVVDRELQELPFQADALLRAVMPYSDASRIITEGAAPDLPAGIFGAEPAHTWCYYFQSAELARQRGEWADVVELGNAARDRGYDPEDETEWLPFIEGYAMQEQYADASELAARVADQSPETWPSLCRLSDRLSQANRIISDQQPIIGQDLVLTLNELAQCSVPATEQTSVAP
ncbi:MAG: hypothetical protein GYB65_15945, partial [Chloroflexi bacterium]|nr:hypothetical protein [Chloroflexota bacterium]